jgi:hypothetical protein
MARLDQHGHQVVHGRLELEDREPAAGARRRRRRLPGSRILRMREKGCAECEDPGEHRRRNMTSLHDVPSNLDIPAGKRFA